MTLKNTSRTLSALALAAVFAAAPLAASASPSGSDHGARHHQKADGHHGMRGHGHHHAHGERWLRGLNLSQEQKDQIFKIRHDQKKAAYEQKKALSTAATALREAQRTQPFDQAKAKQAADALGQAKSQLALLHAQSMADIQAVLTPEQKAKLSERRNKKEERKNKS